MVFLKELPFMYCKNIFFLLSEVNKEANFSLNYPKKEISPTYLYIIVHSSSKRHPNSCRSIHTIISYFLSLDSSCLKNRMRSCSVLNVTVSELINNLDYMLQLKSVTFWIENATMKKIKPVIPNLFYKYSGLYLEKLFFKYFSQPCQYQY